MMQNFLILTKDNSDKEIQIKKSDENSSGENSNEENYNEEDSREKKYYQNLPDYRRNY